ncbi:hypothetical protein FG168_11000 [Vibrio cholerae]|nr:hypothetical protein [Vibrio cholerae]
MNRLLSNKKVGENQKVGIHFHCSAVRLLIGRIKIALALPTSSKFNLALREVLWRSQRPNWLKPCSNSSA